MGLWAQNIGVRATTLPPVVRARAAKENVAVPEDMEGWSWATLDYEFVDAPQLEHLAVEAAKDASAPSMAFSVHDSDSVYVVGADPQGVAFRVVVNPHAWEDELPQQEVEAAAEWATEHGPGQPSPNDIGDVLSRQFVFAEEGLDVLFARMGLLPAEAAVGAEEMDEKWTPDPDVWSWLEVVASPEQRALERARWHAKLRAGGVAGSLLGVEEDSAQLVIDARTTPPDVSHVPVFAVSGYIARPGEPIVFIGQSPTKEELREGLVRQGVEVGEWGAVPDDVMRDLASTASWVLAEPDPLT